MKGDQRIGEDAKDYIEHEINITFADDDQKYCFNTLCGAPIDEWDLHCRWCGAETDVCPEDIIVKLEPVSRQSVTIHLDGDGRVISTGEITEE